MRLFIAAIGSIFSLSAVANWQLDNENSRLHFLSTKNAQVTETHRFESLSGSISADGKLEVNIDLDSVNTAIDIRNTRMREMLFNTTTYPQAQLAATLPEQVLQLSAGESQTLEVAGTLSLHGVEAPVNIEVAVMRLSANEFQAVSLAPVLIDVNRYNLGSGVEALKNVANLASITLTVPVSFQVSFIHSAS